MFFEDNIDNAKYCGHLYGLGNTFITNGNNYHDNGDTNSSWCDLQSTTPPSQWYQSKIDGAKEKEHEFL